MNSYCYLSSFFYRYKQFDIICLEETQYCQPNICKLSSPVSLVTLAVSITSSSSPHSQTRLEIIKSHFFTWLIFIIIILRILRVSDQIKIYPKDKWLSQICCPLLQLSSVLKDVRDLEAFDFVYSKQWGSVGHTCDMCTQHEYWKTKHQHKSLQTPLICTFCLLSLLSMKNGLNSYLSRIFCRCNYGIVENCFCVFCLFIVHCRFSSN